MQKTLINNFKAKLQFKHLVLGIKPNYRIMAKIITSRMYYDMTKGGVTSTASTYMELIHSCFLLKKIKKKPELKKVAQ